MALGPAAPFQIKKHVLDEDFGRLYLIYRYMDLDLRLCAVPTSIFCSLCERLTIISLIGGCNHRYCVQCLDIHARYLANKCSKCKKRFDSSLMRSPPNDQTMDKIESRCPNYFLSRCKIRLKLKDLPTHIFYCEQSSIYREARKNELLSAYPNKIQLNFDKPKRAEFRIKSINHLKSEMEMGLPEANFNIQGPTIEFDVLELPPNHRYKVDVETHYNFKTGKIGLKFKSNATFHQVVKGPFPTVTYVIKVPGNQVHRMESEELSDLVMYGLEEDYFIPMGQEKYIRVLERLFDDNIDINMPYQMHYVSCFDSSILTAIARTQIIDTVEIEVIMEPTPSERSICTGVLKFQIEDYTANVKLIQNGFIDRIISSNFFTSAKGYRAKAELFVDKLIQKLNINILSGTCDDRLRRQNGFLVTVGLKNVDYRKHRRYHVIFNKVVYRNCIQVDIHPPLESFLKNSDLDMKIVVKEVHDDTNDPPANNFLDFRDFDIKCWSVNKIS